MTLVESIKFFRGLGEAQVRLVPGTDKDSFTAVHKKTGKKIGKVTKLAPGEKMVFGKVVKMKPGWSAVGRRPDDKGRPHSGGRWKNLKVAARFLAGGYDE